MPLVHMGDMLHHAYDNRYAVGAFDVVSLDLLPGSSPLPKRNRHRLSSAWPSRISSTLILSC